MGTLAAKLSCLVPDSFELPATGSGKLSGTTFVAKDLLSVAGHTSSFGHPRWRETHIVSKVTAPIISKLLAEGANLVGMAKLDQLAGSLVGNIGEGEAPLNSLYPDRFTGGSSSGSASAVAGGLVDFAIGTDTAGSVRVPAAACGLYGLRPTYGSIKSEGVIPWAASFDAVGILSKDLSLVRAVYEVLSEETSKPTTITRILLPRKYLELVSADVAKVVITTANGLAKKHTIELQEIDFSDLTMQDMRDLFSRLAGRDNWQTHGKWIAKNRDYLALDLQARMEGAKQHAADLQDQVEADLQSRGKFSQTINKLLNTGTVIALPVIPDLPPLRNATDDELLNYREIAVRLNALSGLCGLPEVVMPAISSSNGLTYGVGIVGPKTADIALLDFLID